MKTNRLLLTDLSGEDRSVLERVAEGLRDSEIASQLGMPEGNVERAVTRLTQELGASDRLELTLFALASLSSDKQPKQAQKKPVSGADGDHKAEECG